MTSRETTQLLPLGQDTGIAARLSDRIFTLAWALIQWPWLLRSLSGGSLGEKAAILADVGLASDALPNLGSWKADTFYLRAIVDHIKDHRPSTLVELGAGASSLVAARALQRWGGGTHIAFDQHAGFVAATAQWLKEHGVEADLRTAPLGPPPGDWPGAWYQLSNLPDRIDLLLVDGPPWTLHPFVRGAAETLFDRIPVGGTVFLDDGARPGERVVMARWRKRWPGFRFELLPGGTKGLVRGVRIT
jgi:hypothetical protein